jgi:hypothetical protein
MISGQKWGFTEIRRIDLGQEKRKRWLFSLIWQRLSNLGAPFFFILW